jgi:ribosomal protein L22
MRFVPSSAGICSTMPRASRRSSLSVRMLVGMPSGEATKSLNRVRPKKRSRMTSRVQRSPKMSNEHATGQGERFGAGPFFAI